MASPIPIPSRARLWFSYGAAWLPFAFYWGALVLLDRGSPSFALLAAGVMMGAAAVLGAGVWWLSGRHPWSGSSSGIGCHLGAALVYATVLAGLDAWLSTLRAGAGFSAQLSAAPGLFLRGVLVYSWLYGLVAGVCHAIRAHGRLRVEAFLAARAEAEASRAQLKALRAQLNPHFLFNSLHSLSVLVRRDPAGAEEALERLGEMLRYALQELGDEEVSFAEEWSFTSHYLSLEKLRLGSRLRLETSVEPQVLACRVPCFVLQPLVENAVRHGIAPRVAGGTLRLQAALENDELVIRVADDGPGASPERAQAARGLGMRAVQERVAAHYGPRARVHVESVPGRGFAVSLRLPSPRRAGLQATA